MSPSEGLRVEALDVPYGRRPGLRGIDLAVAPGEIAALLGPNGSGKTTLLRALAGLEPVTAGRVRLDGRDLTDLPTHRRGVGMLFQEPTLFPGRTVEENVAYGLDVARWPAERADARVRELLERMGLAALARRPAEALSGGEGQRVALARTLAPRPRLVLLDEPLAAVDPERRGRLREEFQAALRREGVAAIYVTHDPEEALAVGERLLLLRDGRLVQSGPAAAVFAAPVDPEAARFLGYQLLADGRGGLEAVHPREFALVGPELPGRPGVVESTRPALGERLLWVRLDSGELVEWRRSAGPEPVLPEGATVRLGARRRVAFPGAAPRGGEAP